MRDLVLPDFQTWFFEDCIPAPKQIRKFRASLKDKTK